MPKPVYCGAKTEAEYTFEGTTKKLPARNLVHLPNAEADFLLDQAFTFGGVDVPDGIIAAGGLDPEQKALVDEATGEVVRNDKPEIGTIGQVLHGGEGPKDPCGTWDRFVRAHPELEGLTLKGITLVQK